MTQINLPLPECNRTGTGNIFNLIMRMTVRLSRLETIEKYLLEFIETK